MDARGRLTATVHGAVQGVGFRWFARQQAQLLGCTGYARNDASGTRVEVVAEGSRVSLEALLSRLRLGPSGARVTYVEAEWQETTGEFEQFQIRQ